MENCQLILNSNSLCVFCLSEMEAKKCKANLFPIHHLTSKINSNLGDVFKDVTVPWAPNAVMDRMEVLADVCEVCTDLCEELLYKFQDDDEREKCVKLILDKMEGVGMEDKYKNCDSPAAVFYAGIVDRLRKEIIAKLHLKPDLKEEYVVLDGTLGIPKLSKIPDLPMSRICSYLSFKDIISCSTVNSDLHNLVFPSLISSSFITFDSLAKIPALIEFIKKVYAKFEKGINLSIRFELRDPEEDDGDQDIEEDGQVEGSEDGEEGEEGQDIEEDGREDGGRLTADGGNDNSDERTNLIALFEECGPYIKHLSLWCGMHADGNEAVFGFPNTKPIPVLGVGHEQFPELKGLELEYDEFYSIQLNPESPRSPYLPSVKAILENSPKLNQIKLKSSRNDTPGGLLTPKLLKLIGDSGLPINNLEIEGTFITSSDMDSVKSLKLKKLVMDVALDENDQLSWPNFWKNQSSTLEYFSLETLSELHQFVFPRLGSLKTLKIQLMTDEACLFTFEDGGPSFYKELLPNLERFEVVLLHDLELHSCFPIQASPTNSVKELAILDTYPPLEMDTLCMAIRIFVSLTKLEIPVASYLCDLWKDLSGLEELTLEPKWVTQDGSDHGTERITWIDKIITGLPLSDDECQGATNTLTYEERYRNLEENKSLALLTKLKTFRIRNDKRDAAFPNLKLGDVACNVVLMKMGNLKCIDFCGMALSSVGASRKVLHALGRRINVCFGKDGEW